MASNYYKLTKADFGLRSYSVALPDSPDGSGDAPTLAIHHSIKSRSLDLHPPERSPARPSLKQKLKGWLRGSKRAEEDSFESERYVATALKEPPPLHKRSWMTGKTANANEAEAEQVQAHSNPTFVKLSMRTKANEIYQITLRSSKKGLGMLYSAGLPPITVTFVEQESQAEQAGVKIGDVLLSVNGMDCYNPNVSITQLMNIKAMINQSNNHEDGVAVPERDERQSKIIKEEERLSDVSEMHDKMTDEIEKMGSDTQEITYTQEMTERSTTIPETRKKERLTNSPKIETEEKLSQDSSDIEVTVIDSISEDTSQNQNLPYQDKATSTMLQIQKTSHLFEEITAQASNDLPTMHTKWNNDPIVLHMTVEIEEEPPALEPDHDQFNVPRLKPMLGLVEGHSRRSIVARRQHKHRPATNRHSLLLNNSEAVRMGRMHVDVPISPVKGKQHFESTLTVSGTSSSSNNTESQNRKENITAQQRSTNKRHSVDSANMPNFAAELQGKQSENGSKYRWSKRTSIEVTSKSTAVVSECRSPSSKSEIPNQKFVEQKRTLNEMATKHDTTQPGIVFTRYSVGTQEKRQSLEVEPTSPNTAFEKDPNKHEIIFKQNKCTKTLFEHHSGSPQHNTKASSEHILTSPECSVTPGKDITLTTKALLQQSTRTPPKQPTKPSSEHTHPSLEHNSVPIVHTNTHVKPNTMTRARSHTISSTSALKHHTESKPSLSSKAMSSGSLEDLTAVAEGSIPKRGFVKARMAMFQKQ